jgi:D-glycero-alpha-D-manno-heptose-7-phosphate kinase
VPDPHAVTVVRSFTLPPVRVVDAVAPTRVCDIGGWTDTWFAGHGAVLSLAVSPGVHVRVEAGAPETVLDVVNEGVAVPGPHPLLEAAVEEAAPDGGTAVHVTVRSDAPAGASTGTSAAVVVALLGALDAVTGRRRPPVEVAAAAHRVETERLGLQSGVQDQLCAATGGACFIEVPAYPSATVTPVAVPDEAWTALDRRLLLVFLGPHRSSVVHERVIAELTERDDVDTPLPALRALAHRAHDALAAGDLAGLAEAMQASTSLQAGLAPGIVSEVAAGVIDAARRAGAVGWKVNGAGGEGGSVTVLCGDEPGDRERVERAVDGLGGAVRRIPVALSRSGLRVSEGPA